jgi:hypothetical protein
MGPELAGLENCPLTIINCSMSCESGQVVDDAEPVAARARVEPTRGVALTGCTKDRVSAVVTAKAMRPRINLITNTA